MTPVVYSVIVLLAWQERGLNAEGRPRPAAQAAPRAVAAQRVVVRFAGDPVTLTIEVPEVEVHDDEDDKPDFRPVVVNRFNLQAAVLERENFDRWLFNTSVTEEARRDHLRALLAVELAKAEAEHHLSAAEAGKLRLAGQGDIKRFRDKIAAERRAFEAARQTVAAGRKVLLRLSPLSTEFRTGPFGDDSLFAKTLKRIESDREAKR